MKSNDKKSERLGMPHGTASNRLKKALIFSLVKRLNENFCFRCGLEIENSETLSIEHKISYLNSDNPVELFFDLNNVAYSHLSCNSGARNKTVEHGSGGYKNRKCRCDICRATEAKYAKGVRERRKIKNASVIQLEENGGSNAEVVGSSPARCSQKTG